MLKAIVRECKQHHIVHKKQTVDPAASNSDTLVDLAVTTRPIFNSYRISKAATAHILVKRRTPMVNGFDLTP